MKPILLSVLLLSAHAAAQDRAVSLDEAVKLIGQAQSSLLIYAPTMQNPSVTASYRRAINSLVQVTIITSPQAVNTPGPAERVMPVAFAGYTTKTTTVYAPQIKNLSDSVPFVVVDRRFALAGVNLVQLPLPGDPTTVGLIRDPATVSNLTNWVLANAKANPPVDLLKWFSSHLKRPPQPAPQK